MHLTIAANQGEFGGGEVMQLAIAQAATRLGHDVTVVAPGTPDEVLGAARDRGLRTVAIPGTSAPDYLRNLRRWDRTSRRGLLWCNGLRPAVATAGRSGRVVHLHQAPTGRQRALARLATARAAATIVPSAFVQAQVPGSTVVWNWTQDIPAAPSQSASAGRTVGYLGRLSTDKGLLTLCAAIEHLRARIPGVRLLVAVSHDSPAPRTPRGSAQRSIALGRRRRRSAGQTVMSSLRRSTSSSCRRSRPSRLG